MSKNLLFLMAIVSTMALGIVAIGATLILPQFKEIFESLGDNLPTITFLILATYKWWLAFPLVTILEGIRIFRIPELTRKYAVFSTSVFITGFIIALFLSVVSVWAIYAPIIELNNEKL